jgi:hypothetical protein
VSRLFVSVLVCTHQRRDQALACLASLARMRFPVTDFEVVVSGRRASVHLRTRPRWRTRLATGWTPARRALLRGLAGTEERLRQVVARAPDAPLRGGAGLAADLLAGVCCYRSAETAPAARATGGNA